MCSCRYLMNFAFIGKPYRGLQIQPLHPDSGDTVHNVLQKHLRAILRQPHLKSKLSSRTDKGVNAHSIHLHFDLPVGSTLENGRIFQPPDLEKVARDINRRLYLQRESIRVLNIQQVPRTFHCRFAALTRSYVYRLAIASEDGNTFYERAFKERSEIQWVCCPKFDTRKFIKAAEMFSGRNQFEFYRQADKKNQFIGPTKRSVIVHIRRGISQSNDLCIGSGEFWDIHITGTSFMRKQVRKMVGCMVNIAKGLTTLEGLHQKLDGKGELDDRDIIGPDGLFLKSTTFRKEAVNFADDDQLLDKSDVFYGPHSKDISKHSSLECCGSTCGSTEDTNRINLHSIHGDHVQSSNIILHNSNKQYQLSSEQSINRLVGKEVTN